MKRLTVHVTNQPRVDTQAPKTINKKEAKTAYARAQEQGERDREKTTTTKAVGKKGRYKVYTTITVRDLKDERAVQSALSEIRKNYTIAICPDSRKSYWESGEEMYHTAWQN